MSDFKAQFPEFVGEIFGKFEKAGFKIYVAGGAVRDILTGNIIDDWDFTTNATPEQILNLFPDGYYDNQFGTVGIPDASFPHPHEITTFRKEFGYSDTRRPDKVKWGKTLEEDLSRRDFTVNAMALNSQGELTDLFHGQEDLENKLIRAVGNPNLRFSEDALRMMRAARIAAENNFTIEVSTAEAIRQNATLINKIANERVKEELFKILSSSHPYEGIVLMREVGLLQQILPEFEKGFGIEQKSPGRHHIYDVATHSLLSLKYCESTDPLVRLATLIHDIGKPATYKKLDSGVVTFYNHEIIGSRMAANIAQRLRFSKDEAQKLFLLVRWHQFTVDERQTDSAIRRFITHVGKANLKDIIDLRVADRLGGGAQATSWRLEEFKNRLIEVQKQPFAIRDLQIDGNDVMRELNLKPGPEVGKILEKLFKLVVVKEIPNEKEYLLKELDKYAVSRDNPT
jgi:putative nucleotidyltransferase with HDIG domain